MDEVDVMKEEADSIGLLRWCISKRAPVNFSEHVNLHHIVSDYIIFRILVREGSPTKIDV